MLGNLWIRSSRSRPLSVVLALGAVLVVLSVCGGCTEDAVEPPTGAVDKAKDVAAKAAVLAVATGVKAHVATTGEAPVDASQATLGSYVSPWPDNPFTGAPMQPGASPGDYIYRQLGGGAYELSVYLSDGSLSPTP